MPLPWSKTAGAGPPSEAEVGQVEPEKVREELARILASPEFDNATRLRGFLIFIVGETLTGAATLKETTVAMRVFNRRSSFDPAGDSVVRVAAHNLRSRLREYYRNSGRHDERHRVLPLHSTPARWHRH